MKNFYEAQIKGYEKNIEKLKSGAGLSTPM